MTDPHTSILRRFDPDPSAALRAVSEIVRDEDLEFIASADHGMGYPENLKVLNQCRESSWVPYPLEWNPKEACELTRWEQPELFSDRPSTALDATEVAAHRRRAFACSILLHFAYDDCLAKGDQSMSEGETAAVLVASSLTLGGAVVTASCRTLAAAALVMQPGGDERANLMLGVLLCAVRRRDPEVPASDLHQLGLAVMAEEQLQRDNGIALGPTWMFSCGSPCLSMWRSLANAVLLHPVRPHPEQADEVLRLIGIAACEG